MRRVALLVGVTLLLWACTGGAVSTTTTTTAPTSTTIGSSASSTTVFSTTTAAVPEWPEILVTNHDGVFYIDTSGEITQLVKGRVAYAVDDTRGGLLFQVERGRDWNVSFYGHGPDGGPGKRAQDTVVWWVPSGSSAAQELLVPTPGARHWLSLHDTYRTAGSFAVVYTRDEGSVPFEDAWDTLRIFDVETGAATEVATVGGWEYDFQEVSVGGGLISGTVFTLYGSVCHFFTMTGESVTRPGLPVPDPDCAADNDPSPECPRSCAVSIDGTRIVYIQSREVGRVEEGSIIVADTASGVELMRRALEPREPGIPSALDIQGDVQLVNRRTDLGTFTEGLLIDLADRSERELPVSGKARFVTAPVDIAAPVIPPTPASIQLRADGLGVVDFGDPVEEVVDLMTAVLGVPDHDALDTGGAAAGVSCSERTGMACESYLRSVGWDAGLSLIFSDLHPYGGDGPALVGWSAWEGAERLSTVDGVGPGSTVNSLTTVYGDSVEWIWERQCGVDFYVPPDSEDAIYG